MSKVNSINEWENRIFSFCDFCVVGIQERLHKSNMCDIGVGSCNTYMHTHMMIQFKNMMVYGGIVVMADETHAWRFSNSYRKQILQQVSYLHKKTIGET